METKAMDRIAEDLSEIKERLMRIENGVKEIDADLHEVKPEYLEKLEKIKKEKGKVFATKEEFLQFVHNEV